ncbi:MAG: monovalent cation/H(+) antiporter subunit G [Lachnospiraceae bacterium]|nr:monovalent cation/H(+) antiporter subunit G [Lachnospiraceae bacterium]
MLEWIRFIVAALCIIAGLVVAGFATFGVFKFKFVLNRMHAAAMGDTLAILFVLAGLIVISGFSFTSLKLLLIILFLWFASPVSSHLIAHLEIATDKKVEEECGGVK